MDYGITLTGADVTTALTNFWGIAAVPLLAAAVLGVRFLPQIWRAVKSLVSRR
ncbi:MAG: hypothetical protein HY070_06140 [Chloroflexi bacterium]|nr:hypothetical protein [Chloroflexota bacterium]